MADLAPAAPTTPTPTAAPAAAETKIVSATDAAIETGDVAAYRSGRRAERAGTPLPPVDLAAHEPEAGDLDDDGLGGEPPVEPSGPTSPAPALSKRQQKANDAIRVAVERATADTRAETTRLRAELDALKRPAPVAVAEPVAPAAKEPTYKQYLAMADAPKLEDFESIQEYTFAAGEFIADQREQRRAGEVAAQTTAQRTTAHQQQLVSTFDTRVKALAATDPQIDATIAPVASQIGAQSRQPGAVGEVFRTLSEMVLESDVGPQVLKHLAAAEGGLAAFVRPPDALLGLPPEVALRAHQRHLVTQFRTLEATLGTAAALTPADPAPRHLSAAPPPPHTLGHRPTDPGDPWDKAIKSGKTSEYRKLGYEKRAKQLGLRNR